ncbi:MAG: response regulator [Pseudomonadales bacterium]|nr:response regulator [Pseudomonadales bacterium]
MYHLKVLIVDDDPDDSELLSQALIAQGFPSPTVAVGSDVVSAEFSVEAFDLVVTDLQMPGISGFEVALHIAENFPRIPVIGMSGASASELGILKVYGAVSIAEKTADYDAVVEQVLRHAKRIQKTDP